MSLQTVGAWKLENAQAVAERVIEQLKPYCDRIFLGGSIRRKEPYVNDIEIICEPKLIPQTIVSKVTILQENLFGENELAKTVKAEEGTARHPEFINCIEQWDKIIGDPKVGRNTRRILTPENIRLDIFMPQSHDFFRMLAIRTGSQVFVREYIASGWRAKGWVGTKDGLRRIEQCTQDPNDLWICLTDQPMLPPEWESEEEFFAFLGYRYTLPENRCYG